MHYGYLESRFKNKNSKINLIWSKKSVITFILLSPEQRQKKDIVNIKRKVL